MFTLKGFSSFNCSYVQQQMIAISPFVAAITYSEIQKKLSTQYQFLVSIYFVNFSYVFCLFAPMNFINKVFYVLLCSKHKKSYEKLENILHFNSKSIKF